MTSGIHDTGEITRIPGTDTAVLAPVGHLPRHRGTGGDRPRHDRRPGRLRSLAG